MIELKEPRPPAPPEVIADTERRLAALGRPLPPSYRAFLAEQDGGRPVKNTFTFQQHDRDTSSRVAVFFGAQPTADGDLAGTAGLSGDVPVGFLAIAGDEFGNLICLDGREGRDGPVLFWDHEEGFDDGEPDFSNLYEIAPDLRAFLDALTEPEPPPLAPQRERTGWRRVFGR